MTRIVPDKHHHVVTVTDDFRVEQLKSALKIAEISRIQPEFVERSPIFMTNI